MSASEFKCIGMKSKESDCVPDGYGVHIRTVKSTLVVTTALIVLASGNPLEAPLTAGPSGLGPESVRAFAQAMLVTNR